MSFLLLFSYPLKPLSSKLRLILQRPNLNIRKMLSLTCVQRQQQKNLERLWHIWVKSILLPQRMTLCCQTLATLMSLQHGKFIPKSEKSQGWTMVVDWMNSRGYEKLETDPWFFPVPWQTSFFFFSLFFSFSFIHSFIHSSLTHHGVIKMTQITNKHSWGDFQKCENSLSTVPDLSGP